MNLPYFIARRISKNKVGSFTTVIHRIAVISITVALATLISSFMILKGFEETIKAKVYSFSGHLIISKYTLSTSFEESVITINDSLKNALEAVPEVDYVQEYGYKAGLLKTDEEVQGIILKGLDKRFDTTAFNKHMVRGSFPVFPEEGYGTDVVVSSKIANYLRLDVGDQVMVFFVQNPPRYRKLTITGVYETGMEDFDEKMIIGDINMIRKINGWDQNTVGGLEVFLEEPDEMDRMEDELFDQTGSDLYVDKVSDKYVQIFDWLRLLNRNVVIFFTLILFVASFNMVSILLILIMERTNMVGTFKALGANNQILRRVFLYSGLNLIFKGVLWGNLIGLAFCAVQYYFKLIPMDAANYYMNHVPITFDFEMVILLNIFIVIVTGVTLFIPLSVVSRINPIKAIRFD